MRITCFVIGALCLAISAVWAGIGVLDLAGGSSASTSTPTVAGVRMTQAAVPSPNIDDFGPASTFAQIFAIAGVAWMVGAAAFAPRQTTPATTPDQPQWQPQQYTPQWQQPQSQQYPDQQS